jgi:hypothetical protein
MAKFTTFWIAMTAGILGGAKVAWPVRPASVRCDKS